MQTVQEPKQILVVEDEGLIAADIQTRLERMGYAVPAVAHSGEEAIRCARSRRIDLVLMDIRLKGEMDGIATAQALKDELEMPVVYVTAHSDQETLNRAKLTEPLGYVLKPIGDGNLHSTLQMALYKSEMERRLRESEAWLSTTLRSVGEGIVATNPTGEIVFMNPVAEQLLGCSATHANGRLLMEVLDLWEEHAQRPAKDPVFDLLPGETRPYTLVSKAGHKTVEVACFENRAGDEVLGAILVIRDIGARRALEASLMQSQRMEAVANMAGGLSHDFNNQLMVILGYADELSRHLTGAGRQDALEIKQAAEIAGSITSQLLTLSRRQVARYEILNLNEVICEIQPLLSHTLGNSRTLETAFGSPAGFVRADRNQFKQILVNLALNARDAMPGGGELRIETATVEVGPGSPAAPLPKPGPYVRLSVVDTGHGIDPDILARIFEPFFTTKKPGLGTGLGLSIVHSIVTQSGGSITAHSEPGRGTRFEILLPCAGTFLGSPMGEDTPTVLLVEDEDSVRRLMHSHLEREGYQLLAARDAEEAESIANVYRGPIHLLVTDVILPGMKGPDLAQKLAPLRPEMQVLFVSGYRHDTLEDNGVARHAELLAKPFPGPELLRRIRLLLRQQPHSVQ